MTVWIHFLRWESLETFYKIKNHLGVGRTEMVLIPKEKYFENMMNTFL